MIKMVITTAGRQALINSASTGTNAVKIAAIGVGTGRYTPTESQTALQAEVKRLNIVEGGSAGDNAFHVAYRDESADAYAVYEFGLFLDSGILFAVYSTSELLLQKSASAIAELAVDIALSDVNVSQIEFGDVTYSNPAATTENAGVLAIATADEVQAGEASQKALTPANIQALTATETRKGIVDLATADEAKTGAETTKVVTPATAKAMFDNRLATSAETIAGTNSTKVVTPAGLASLTANNTRKGLIETATEAETIAGTDTTRAVTPAGLQAKINALDKPASETERGFIQIATEAEAVAGTNNTKAMTPAKTKAAIENYDGSIDSALVTATGATTGRTLAARFADSITPKDYGAKGNGTVDDTAAFTALEKAVSGRDVDLEGLTYLVTTRPSANNYYNGLFKIGTETVKPVYDFYKFGGTSERFINVKRDFSEATRGGAALLAADYVRSGAAAGAVVQSVAWDDVNRYLYTLHVTTGDLGVVNRFSNMKLGAAIVNAPSAYTAASAYIGHQGLAVEHRDGGAIKLWASMAYETAGAGVTSKGTKAVRFNAPTSENQNVDSSVEIFNLFPEVSGSNQATTVCISYSGKYLIAKYSVNGTNNYRVRVFKVSDLTAAGDYSNKYIHEFTIELTRDVDGGVEKALQGMACDDRYIYFLASTYGYDKKHSIYIADMFGNIVDEYRDMSVGKEIGKSAGTTYYEPQSLFFMSLNGQPKLCMQIATGDNVGDRLCHLIVLNARQSYYFPTGSGTGSKHALAIDEQARVVNADGAANISLYPSGLSQNFQARAGANQTAMARFSNDASGNSFVMFKSRGANVGASGSAVAGDIIGQFAFLVDNGNIDYDGSIQGARAAYIEGGVFENSTLTASGTTNIGVRGYLRFYVCSDANSRSGEGLELIDNVFRPLSDNVLGLGTAQRRFKAIYAATDVISTSDESTKQDVAEIPDEVLTAWGNVDFQQFRFIDEVEKEGENAKLYFGVVAQRIVEAFEAAGIDACEYGLVCKETLEDGSTLYGVRYREALALEAEFARRKIEAVNTRVQKCVTKTEIESGVQTQTVFGYDPMNESLTNNNVYLDGENIQLMSGGNLVDVPAKAGTLALTSDVEAADKANADAIATKANDTDVVHKSGNETITGLKCFEGSLMFGDAYPSYMEVAGVGFFHLKAENTINSSRYKFILSNVNIDGVTNSRLRKPTVFYIRGGMNGELLATTNDFSNGNITELSILPLGTTTALGAPAYGLHVSATGGLQLFGTHFLNGDIWTDDSVKMVKGNVSLTSTDTASIGFDYANKVVFRTMPNDGTEATYELQAWQWDDDSHTTKSASAGVKFLKPSQKSALESTSVLNMQEGDARWWQDGSMIIQLKPNGQSSPALMYLDLNAGDAGDFQLCFGGFVKDGSPKTDVILSFPFTGGQVAMKSDIPDAYTKAETDAKIKAATTVNNNIASNLAQWNAYADLATASMDADTAKAFREEYVRAMEEYLADPTVTKEWNTTMTVVDGVAVTTSTNPYFEEAPTRPVVDFNVTKAQGNRIYGSFNANTSVPIFLPNLTDGASMFTKSKQSPILWLPNLINGEEMFWNGVGLTSWVTPLPKLTKGGSMFNGCSALISWTAGLPELNDGYYMFQTCTGLTSWTVDLPKLTKAEGMFRKCDALTSWTADLPKLTNGKLSFQYCSGLTSWTVDLPSLTDGYGMFNACTGLTSWEADLPKLSDGVAMFQKTGLTAEAICNVLNVLPVWTDGGSHTIGFVGCPGIASTATEETFTVTDEDGTEYSLANCPVFTTDDADSTLRKAYVLAIAKKGWTVEI